MKISQFIACVSLVSLMACGSDDAAVSTPATTTTQAPAAGIPPAAAQGATDARTAADQQVPGLDMSTKKVVAGEIKDFGDRDIKSEGRALGESDARSEKSGFAGVNPCDVIEVNDLKDFPGGTGKISSERNNVGDIVLGCVYSFMPDGKRTTGKISVYFSDNQTTEKAAESVAFIGDQVGSAAVTDWDRPASFSAGTGDFVWSRGRNFVTLVIEHPAVTTDRLEWSKRIASAIDARLQD